MIEITARKKSNILMKTIK